MGRTWAVVLLVVLPAGAGNPFEDAVAAHRAGDTAKLAALARLDYAWQLACTLCAYGKADVAMALARASDHADVKRLPEHVARWTKQPLSQEATGRMQALEIARRGDRWQEVLESTETPVSDDPFVAVHAAASRGVALAHVDDERAVAVLKDAARRAGEMGWLEGQWLAMHNLAWFYGVTHRHKEALEGFLAEVWQKEHRKVPTAGALANLGAAYGSVGDYRNATVFLERAAAEQRADGDPDLATTLNNCGLVYAFLGDYAAAYALFEEALAATGKAAQWMEAMSGLSIVEVKLGNLERAEELARAALERATDARDEARIVQFEGNLANVHEERGDLKAARAAYERARDAARRLRHTWFEAIAEGNLAIVDFKLGEAARAREGLRAAIPKLEKVGHASMRSRCRVRLGQAEAMLGHSKEARAQLDAALAEAREHDSGAIELLALEALATLHLESGDPAAAVVAARRGSDVLWRLVRGLSDEQGAGARQGHSGLFAVAIPAACAREDPAALAEFIEKSRAGALLESLQQRETIRGALVPPQLREEENEANTNVAIARRRYLDAARGGRRDAIRQELAALEAARGKVAEIQQRIQRTLKAGAALVYPDIKTLEEIRAQLQRDEALVEYALLEEEGFALVATRTSARVVRLGDAGDIREAASRYADQYRRGGDRGVRPERRATGTAGPESLRRLVLEPLALKARRVLISPDGALYRVPFATLLPGRDVAYVPSGTTYALLRPDAKIRGEAVLAVGAPDYAGRGLNPLPATRGEAKKIGTKVLLARSATEPAFWKAIAARPRWRAVHLACHGIVDDRAPLQSALALTAAPEHDGLLTAFEVVRGQVPADLVALSACDTGAGKVYRGEGLLGLTRAFLYAGSPRVLVSLWKVDDMATRALMEKFYELWLPGKLATAAALRKAQEFVASRPKWKDPYYWAAWQLWGAPD